MDAVAFPPPPAPFLDDDFEFGNFTFASVSASATPQLPVPNSEPATFAAFDDDWGDFVASPIESNPDPSAPPTPPSSKSKSAWEKPRGRLPLSLFGAEDEEEEPAEPPPTATAHQRAPSVSSHRSRPAADLKDLIADLYGSQAPSAPDAAAASAEEEAVDDDGFGDDGWEFKAASALATGTDGGDQTHEDGIEDIPKSFGSDQEDWSLFTGPNENLSSLQDTDHIGTPDSTGQSIKDLGCSPSNRADILSLYKEHEQDDAVHIAQSSEEIGQSTSDLFSNSAMNSSFQTGQNHSIKSTGDSITIDFYHRLREVTSNVISWHIKDLKGVQEASVLSGRNGEVTSIGKEIQEICEKLQDFALCEGFSLEEHPSRDVCIDELQRSTKEEHLKDFEREYHLSEKLALALEDVCPAIELYRHSVSTLHILQVASKEERHDYAGTWYSILLSCAQELQHGAVLWQESCHAGVCNQVLSEGGHCFVALGEIYRVAQILSFSLHCFRPWVLADPGKLSEMLACLDNCTNAWTSGLDTALIMVVDTDHSDASTAKALLESIKNINELEVPNCQKFLTNELTCKLTLVPTTLLPGMEVVMWNGDHYFVKVANLWANQISSDAPRLSCTPVAVMNNEA